MGLRALRHLHLYNTVGCIHRVCRQLEVHILHMLLVILFSFPRHVLVLHKKIKLKLFCFNDGNWILVGFHRQRVVNQISHGVESSTSAACPSKKTLRQLGCCETSLLICEALKTSGPPQSRSNIPLVAQSSRGEERGKKMPQWHQGPNGQVCFS